MSEKITGTASAVSRYRPRKRGGAVVAAVCLLLCVWWYSPRSAVVLIRNSRWLPVCWSPDGTRVAAVSRSQWFQPVTSESIQLLRATDLTELGPAIDLPRIAVGDRLDAPQIHKVQFSPNARELAVLQSHRDREKRDQRELLLIDLSAGKIKKSVSMLSDACATPGEQNAFCFSPDGRRLAYHEVGCATAGAGEFSRRRDRVSVLSLYEDREPYVIEAVHHPVFSPDGDTLAVVDAFWRDGKCCRLYSVSRGEPVAILPLPGDDDGWRPQPQFSPDGRFLAVGSRSDGKERVTVFQLGSNKKVMEVAEWSPAFVSDSILVTASEGGLQFRSCDDWERRQVTGFSPGSSLQNGSVTPPEPISVPDAAVVVVRESGGNDLLLADWLSRSLGYGSSLSPKLSIVDAATGGRTTFRLDAELLNEVLLSPDGQKMLVNCIGSTGVWHLPPGRSLRPVLIVAFFLGVLFLCRNLVTIISGRRRRATSGSEVSHQGKQIHSG